MKRILSFAKQQLYWEIILTPRKLSLMEIRSHKILTNQVYGFLQLIRNWISSNSRTRAPPTCSIKESTWTVMYPARTVAKPFVQWSYSIWLSQGTWKPWLQILPRQGCNTKAHRRSTKWHFACLPSSLWWLLPPSFWLLLLWTIHALLLTPYRTQKKLPGIASPCETFSRVHQATETTSFHSFIWTCSTFKRNAQQPRLHNWSACDFMIFVTLTKHPLLEITLLRLSVVSNKTSTL